MCSCVQLWVLSKHEPSNHSSIIPAASFAGLFALDFCWVETAMLVLLQTFMLIDNDVAA